MQQYLDTFEPESLELDFKEMVERHKSGEEGHKIHVRKYKDAVYFGLVNSEKKRNGKGVMIYSNGRKYEGDWKDDVRHGRGYEIHPNLNIYIGEFVNGKAHGHGIY